MVALCRCLPAKLSCSKHVLSPSEENCQKKTEIWFKSLLIISGHETKIKRPFKFSFFQQKLEIFSGNYIRQIYNFFCSCFTLKESSLYSTLVGNNFSKVEPNPIILNRVPSGKLLKNNCKAFLAWFIRLPAIEPLRSTRKTGVEVIRCQNTRENLSRRL